MLRVGISGLQATAVFVTQYRDRETRMHSLGPGSFPRLRSLVSSACLLLAAIAVFPGSGLAADKDWVYVMRPGDTLIGIAQRYFADPHSWPAVQERNGIVDPFRIPAGSRLKIPVRLLRSAPLVAEVLMVNGKVTSVPAGGGDARPVSAGDALPAGVSVRVAAGSNLSLRFPDGSRLLVLENSRFTLKRAVSLGKTADHAGLQRIQIELSEGRVESSAASLPGGANQYEIHTPALRMAVRGTRFRSATDTFDGLARSEVLAGRVQISGAHRSVNLGAGFGTYALSGEAPGKAQRLAPPPELVEPRKLIERLPLRFAWQPMPNVGAYRAQVLDSAANMVLDSVFQVPTARWADLADGRYILRVRAIDENRLEGLDAEHAFTLKARPEPPFVRKPIDKAYGEPTRFEWTEATGEGSYHFQLASDKAFARLLADEPALTADHLERPLVPGNYFWRIARIDGQGDHGPFGDAISFEQRPVPASPQAEEPKVGDESLHFRWLPGEPGQSFLLQMARTPEFDEIVLEQSTDQAFIDVPRPEAGEYYMRIRAIEADGFVGPFGAAQRFTVPASPAWWLLLLLIPFAL